MIPSFEDNITDLRKFLHTIVDDLTEEDIRLFFKLNNYQQDQGLCYLSDRYRFRQIIDFATRDVVEGGPVYGRTFDPDLTNRLTYINICKQCGQKNKATNAYICPDCEKQNTLAKEDK